MGLCFWMIPSPKNSGTAKCKPIRWLVYPLQTAGLCLGAQEGGYCLSKKHKSLQQMDFEDVVGLKRTFLWG